VLAFSSFSPTEVTVQKLNAADKTEREREREREERHKAIIQVPSTNRK